MNKEQAALATESILEANEIIAEWQSLSVDNLNILSVKIAKRLVKLREELRESKQDYDTLVGLLRKRFPAKPDGTLPDFKIEDVLRENEELRKKLSS